MPLNFFSLTIQELKFLLLIHSYLTLLEQWSTTKLSFTLQISLREFGMRRFSLKHLHARTRQTKKHMSAIFSLLVDKPMQSVQLMRFILVIKTSLCL